ncbi:LPS export ABC transporter periplasmic protein LptC [bacterium]|nr:LPS export ABC transporter periplasmic protein LptC [bacterium]
MTSRPQIVRLASVALLSLAIAAGGARAEPATNAAGAPTPVPAATGFIERFEVPERDADGNLRWKLRGERAQFKADGQMDLVGVRAEFYESNQVQMVFITPACTLNQSEKRAATDAAVHLQHDNIVMTGQGADWSGAEHSFIVHSNVVVVIGARTSPQTDEPPVVEPAAPERKDEEHE